MKFIYIILLFMIFANIFTFLFASIGVIPYTIEVSGDTYELNDITNVEGEQAFERITEIDFDDVVSLSLKNVDLLLIAAGGIAMAILMRNPAPFAVGLFLGIFINTFRRSTALFYGFQADAYLTLAAMVGVIFIIVITMIEYFTQGDA